MASNKRSIAERISKSAALDEASISQSPSAQVSNNDQTPAISTGASAQAISTGASAQAAPSQTVTQAGLTGASNKAAPSQTVAQADPSKASSEAASTHTVAQTAQKQAVVQANPVRASTQAVPTQNTVPSTADSAGKAVTSASVSSGLTFGASSQPTLSQVPVLKSNNPFLLNPKAPAFSTSTAQQSPFVKGMGNNEIGRAQLAASIHAVPQSSTTGLQQNNPAGNQKAQSQLAAVKHSQTAVQGSSRIEKSQPKSPKGFGRILASKVLANQSRLSANTGQESTRRNTDVEMTTESQKPLQSTQTAQRTTTDADGDANMHHAELASNVTPDAMGTQLSSQNLLAHQNQMLYGHVLSSQTNAQDLTTIVQKIDRDAETLRNRNLVLTECRDNIMAAWDEGEKRRGVEWSVLKGIFLGTLEDLRQMTEFLSLRGDIDNDSYQSIIAVSKSLTAEALSQLPQLKVMKDMDEVLLNAGATVENNEKPSSAKMLNELWQNFETSVLSLVQPPIPQQNVDFFKQELQSCRANLEILVRVTSKMGFNAYLKHREFMNPQERGKKAREVDSASRHFTQNSARMVEKYLGNRINALTNGVYDKVQLQPVMAQLHEIINFMSVFKVEEEKAAPTLQMTYSAPLPRPNRGSGGRGRGRGR